MGPPSVETGRGIVGLSAIHPMARGRRSLRVHQRYEYQRRLRLAKVIPDAPPLSTNEMPSVSSATFIAVRLFAIGTRRPFSKSRTVESETEALAAS